MHLSLCICHYAPVTFKSSEKFDKFNFDCLFGRNVKILHYTVCNYLRTYVCVMLYGID